VRGLMIRRPEFLPRLAGASTGWLALVSSRCVSNLA
jgi:hypothetical protein